MKKFLMNNKSYIVSIDIGSSRTKVIIMMVLNDDISFLNKFICDKKENLENYITKKLEKLKIEKDDIECFVLTGGGATFYEDSFLNRPIEKIEEFDAAGLGGIILAKVDEGIVVNLGTGTSIVAGDINNIKYLSSVALGTGTFIGLSNRMHINFKDIDELFLKANKGDIRNVDLNMSDICKNNIGILNKDLTSCNFGAYEKKATEDDIVAGLLSMIIQSIGILLKSVKDLYVLRENKKDIKIIFIGSPLKYEAVKKYLKIMEKYTKEKYIFVKDLWTEYAVAIGAYEYYFLKIRKNI